MLGKALHAALGLVVGHTGEAEVAHNGFHVDGIADEFELPQHLVGRSPRHEFDKVSGCSVHTVLLNILPNVAVELIAFVLTEMLGRHLIVFHGRVIIGSDPLGGPFFGSLGVFIHIEETAAEWLGRLGAGILFLPDLVVDLEISFDDIPRFLRNDQQADAEPGHDRHGLRRDCRSIGATLKRVGRVGADIAAGLLDRRAAFDIAFLQSVHDEFGVFNKAFAALVLVDPKSVILDPGQTPTEAQDHPPARHMVKQGDLLGNPNRVVPGQHDDHGAQLGLLGPARHIGQKLNRVGTHSVIRKVVLDRPNRVKPQGFGHLRDPQFLTVDFGIGASVSRVLKYRGVTNVHKASFMIFALKLQGPYYRQASSVRIVPRGSLVGLNERKSRQTHSQISV